MSPLTRELVSKDNPFLRLFRKDYRIGSESDRDYDDNNDHKSGRDSVTDADADTDGSGDGDSTNAATLSDTPLFDAVFSADYSHSSANHSPKFHHWTASSFPPPPPSPNLMGNHHNHNHMQEQEQKQTEGGAEADHLTSEHQKKLEFEQLFSKLFSTTDVDNDWHP